MRSFAVLIAISCLVFPALAHADGAIFGGANCNELDQVVVDWTFLEDAPYGHPEWVGYDVLRRTIDPCGELVRLNATVIPRGVGNHSRSFTDTSPTTGVAYEYLVLPVDASRNTLELYAVRGDFYVSCPAGSAAIAHGTLLDLGWALMLQPCSESCAWYFIENASPELKAYAGTGEALRLYGHAACGGVEGCSLVVDHYEVSACTPVPTLPATWGKVKANYR